MKWQEIKIIIIIIKFSFTWIRNIPCDTNAEGIYKWKLNTMTKKLITITNYRSWLPMHRRIAFKILMLMRNCLAGQAPVYLRELCVPVSSLPGRRSLRSAEQGDLVVPRVRLATAQRRSFAVVG